MFFPEIAKVVFSIGRIKNKIFTPLGTCLLLKNGIFATASHVTNGNDENLYIRLNELNFNDYQDPHVNKLKCISAKIVQIDPINDTCLVSIEQNNVNSTLVVSDTDNLSPGEQVTVFGFPHSTDTGRMVLTQQTCEIGAKIFLNSGGIKSKHIVLNIQSRPGQSGSPIIRNSDLSLIGILIGAYVPSSKAGIRLGNIDPQSLHQTTHAVSTEYLRRMLP